MHGIVRLKRIGLGVHEVTALERRLVNEVLESGQFSPGPKVMAFEERFAELHSCRYGMMVNSGTDALRIALATLKECHGWPDGSKVIVPAVTFVATANVVLQNNLEPLFVDVGMLDYNLNPAMVERYVAGDGTGRIKAIIVAHLFGQPADMPSIMSIARRYRLRVIEDSCETMLARVKDRPVGSWGDIACFSTYMAHLITTGVGGLTTTNSRRYADLMRSYMNHGRDPSYLPGYRMPKLSRDLLEKRFRFVRIGFSSRPSEFEAALGLAQLPHLPAAIGRRRAVAEAITAILEPFTELALPSVLPDREHAFMMYPIVIREDSSVKKVDLCLALEEAGIETREMLPLINQPCYAKLVDGSYMGYSIAKWINEKGFYIPCHQGIGVEELDRLKAAFSRFFEKVPA